MSGTVLGILGAPGETEITTLALGECITSQRYPCVTEPFRAVCNQDATGRDDVAGRVWEGRDPGVQRTGRAWWRRWGQVGMEDSIVLVVEKEVS